MLWKCVNVKGMTTVQKARIMKKMCEKYGLEYCQSLNRRKEIDYYLFRDNDNTIYWTSDEPTNECIIVKIGCNNLGRME